MTRANGHRFFSESDYFTGPALTEMMIRSAERDFGVTLPTSYIRLLSEEQNGGTPTNKFVYLQLSESQAAEPVEVDAVLGIGGQWGIDSETQGSRVMVQEWGYPDVGIVICCLASGGHDCIMLDYASVSSGSEPRVIYVDDRREVHHASVSFADFIGMFTTWSPSV